ncbi:MAG TPA: TMEM165/GDT1 family protein [Firmicutes bacterium]|jgi:putative Ca2+/H+ antiporter (TMEM165/GDT1 family)|nr:TMEM165/GDT1 family protein [Bacillota bacterium]
MLYEIGKAAALIFVAELGDKTQILAMTFALQFAVGQVLAGVALGSFLNHGLAVIVGAYLAHIIPLSVIRLGSAVMFLGFGLWTLKKTDDEDHKTNRRFSSPILVVALAFFLGELGDKTQLTAIALASNAQIPWAVLAGTVLGMVLTSLVGIIVGSKLGERIPDFALKLISSAVFIGFGVFHLSQTVPARFLTAPYVLMFSAALVALLMYLVIPLFRERRLAQESPGNFRTVAAQLHALDKALSELCLNDEHCRNERCPVGYCKRLVKAELYGGTAVRGLRKPYVKRDQVFDSSRVDEVLHLLEKVDLSPAVYKELKENVEKLKR